MSVEREFRPYRVLVVDDQKPQRVAIVAAIRDVVPFCDFKEAINVTNAGEVLRRETLPFDLAIVDLRLEESDKDGVALVGIIKEVLNRHSQTRIIIYTAFPDVRTACSAYEAGANAYISKLDGNSTEKLQKKAKQLLEQLDIRHVLSRQHEAQKKAERAFKEKRQDWIKEYGGKLIVVRNGKVIENGNDPHDVWRALGKYTTEERCNMAIIEVPTEGDTDAKG